MCDQKSENFELIWKNVSGGDRPEVFFKKGVLWNFTKLTGKHLSQSLFFNKVAGFSLQIY